MLKLLFFSVVSLWLVACANTTQYRHFHCLASVEEARTVGQEIFYAGFSQRVGNRLGLAPDEGLQGLGLAWDGFDPKPYCEHGAPVVVTYEPKTTKHDPEQVMFWSKVILTEMLKQRGYSAI